MLDELGLPNIETVFEPCKDEISHQLYRNLIRKTLLKITPPQFFIEKGRDLEAFDDVRNQFHSMLPILSYSKPGQFPCNISFFLLCKYRPKSSRFFFEMITCWLVPGKRLVDHLFYAVDFKMPDISNDKYTLAEVVIQLDSQAEWEMIQRNLPLIETEVRLGVGSSHYARRILEIKGLSADEKTVLIQEYMAHLIQRLPKSFDYDLFAEMQHVMVMCRDEFKSIRESTHLSRIISVHYLFRKSLLELTKEAPDKRHLSLKLFKAMIRTPTGNKSVLAILVGVNFLRDKEVFEERHLVKAIQNYIPHVQAVKGSFFANRRGSENIGTLYLELAKDNGQEFTGDEIQRLRGILPNDLKDRIEHLMHPIFMPRNEEEIMRNILSLSNQIKYLRDIPQAFISFDEQNHHELVFMVIIVRVLKPDSLSIQTLFNENHSPLGYVHDRSKIVGFLRKKYAKEATVFRLKLRKEEFLRGDHSIDLNKARQVVANELSRVLGDFRDFNGGMISKQNELLCAVRDLLAEGGEYNDLLLENFFYSLNPVIMRSVLDPNTLKTLFMMLLEVIDDRLTTCDFNLKIHRELDFVYIMIRCKDPMVQEHLCTALHKLNLASTELATAFVNVQDTPCLGYIYRCDDPYKQEHFCQTILYALESDYMSVSA